MCGLLERWRKVLQGCTDCSSFLYSGKPAIFLTVIGKPTQVDLVGDYKDFQVIWEDESGLLIQYKRENETAIRNLIFFNFLMNDIEKYRWSVWNDLSEMKHFYFQKTFLFDNCFADCVSILNQIFGYIVYLEKKSRCCKGFRHYIRS